MISISKDFVKIPTLFTNFYHISSENRSEEAQHGQYINLPILFVIDNPVVIVSVIIYLYRNSFIMVAAINEAIVSIVTTYTSTSSFKYLFIFLILFISAEASSGRCLL